MYIRPTYYRPIRIYVGGEVTRPGYYTFKGQDLLDPLGNADTAGLLADDTLIPTQTFGGARKNSQPHDLTSLVNRNNVNAISRSKKSAIPGFSPYMFQPS